MVSITNKRKGQEPVKDYNAVDYTETENPKKAKLSYAIAESVGKHLLACYPGMMWRVQCDVDTGVLHVLCDTLNYDNGYIVLLGQKNIKELQDAAYRGASEILERYYLPRSKSTVRFHDDFKRDLKGNAVGFDNG